MHTIVAPACPIGGGLCIIRISGEKARPVLERLFARKITFESHKLYHGALSFEGVELDEVMAAFMRAPKTFTGEDVAEIFCHGGAYIVSSIIDACLSLGLVLAKPGEFSRRAFENGRIDLAQAEAVMDLVAGKSASAVRASLEQLHGGLSTFINERADEVLSLIASIEACLDFPEEMEEEKTAEEIQTACLEIIKTLDASMHPEAGKVLFEGIKVAIIGSPNVGKSTLLNTLLGEERAIVTDVPGTTRDVLTYDIMIEDVLFHISDTAGMRKSHDTVERIGIEKAKEAMRYADIAVFMLDASRPMDINDQEILSHLQEIPSIVCINKTDLPDMLDRSSLRGQDYIELSLKSKKGVDALCAALIKKGVGERKNSSPDWLVHKRHVESAKRAREALLAAASALDAREELDMVAIDLKAALMALYEITGAQVEEEVVDRIFADFCVGK